MLIMDLAFLLATVISALLPGSLSQPTTSPSGMVRCDMDMHQLQEDMAAIRTALITQTQHIDALQAQVAAQVTKLDQQANQITEQANEITILEDKVRDTFNHTLDMSANVAFFALRNSAGLSGTRQPQTVTYEVVPLNYGDGFNPLSSHFQAKVHGIYQFHFSTVSGINKEVSLQLVKNGQLVVYAHSGYVTGANGYRNCDNVAIVELAVGDEVWVELREYPGFSIQRHAGFTTFSGHLIFKK